MLLATIRVLSTSRSVPTNLGYLASGSSRETREPDSEGEWRSRLEQNVESDTGLVTCRRVLSSDITRSTNDIIKTFTRDSLGHVTDVRTYGGGLPNPTDEQ